MRCRSAVSFQSKKGKTPIEHTRGSSLSIVPSKSHDQSHPVWPFPYRRGLKTTFNSENKTDLTLVKILDRERDQRSSVKQGDEGSAIDSIKLYFKNLKRYPLISPEEEKGLARKIARGDREARNKMVESNLRLVINIAKRYMYKGLPLHDLIEEGNIGLIQAVEHFKSAKGCKFSTYATFWIKQAIERAIVNQSNVVRIPIHVSADISRLMKADRELTAILSRQPDIIELSEKTGFSGRYIKKLNTIMKKSCSLEASIDGDGCQTLLDLIEDDTSPQPVELINRTMVSEKINNWLKMLDEKERTVIRRRFGFDEDESQTLQSIGKSIGVCRERIRQIERKALHKLQDIVRKDAIRPAEIL